MKLAVLTYHFFHRGTPYGIKPEDYTFSVAIDDFRTHCQNLTASNCYIIDGRRLNDREQYTGLHDRRILITIDDGHASVEDLALDTILEYGLSPVLHVVPDFVGTGSYLDWPSLRNLAAKGCSIQSHSMDHISLIRMGPVELEASLEGSKKIIEDKIGEPVTVLAAPMGRLNRLVIETAHRVGYEIIMTSYTGLNTDPDNLRLIRRFQVKTHLKTLRVDDYFNRFSMVRTVGAVKNMVKRLRDGML